MAAVTRKADATRNRTTDTFPDGKKYHFFKGDPLLENFIVIEMPNDLGRRVRPAAPGPDVDEQFRIDALGDYEFLGAFTNAEKNQWDRNVLWYHLMLPELRDFVGDAALEIPAWTDARVDDGLVGGIASWGIPLVAALAAPASDVRVMQNAAIAHTRPPDPGARPISLTSGTYLDRATPLTNGSVYTHLEFWNQSVVASFDLLLVERTTEGIYDVVQKVEGLSHGGKSWEEFPALYYQVPATGDFFAALYLPSGATIDANALRSRATAPTKATGIGFPMTEDVGDAPGLGMRLLRAFPTHEDLGITAGIPPKIKKFFEALR